MLTTIDNPYDPFENFSDWYNFDRQMGYNTPGYLANVLGDDSMIPPDEYDDAVRAAMETIVNTNPTKIYKIVFKKD